MRKARPSPMVLVSMRRMRLLLAGLAEQALAGAEDDREDRSGAARRRGRARSALARADSWRRRGSRRRAPASASRPRPTTSPFRTVELFQRGSSRVEDTTYLGRLLSLSAHSPLRDDHRDAEPLVAAPTQQQGLGAQRLVERDLGPLLRGPCPQTRRTSRRSLKPSSPSGSWTTPSSEMFVLMTIFPISVLLSLNCWLLRSLRRRPRGKLSGEFPAAPTSLAVMRVKGRAVRGCET